MFLGNLLNLLLGQAYGLAGPSISAFPILLQFVSNLLRRGFSQNISRARLLYHIYMTLAPLFTIAPNSQRLERYIPRIIEQLQRLLLARRRFATWNLAWLLLLIIQKECSFCISCFDVIYFCILFQKFFRFCNNFFNRIVIRRRFLASTFYFQPYLINRARRFRFRQ